MYQPGRMALANVVATPQRAPMRELVYGVEGVGKTQWAAAAPAPIFLCSEEGARRLAVGKFPVVRSWMDVHEALDVLEREPHGYQTLVVDTLDALEPHVWRFVCEQHNAVGIESLGYGKGYTYALEVWQQLTFRLDQLQRTRDMHVILLAHSQVKKHSSPDAEDFDRYTLKLNEKAGAHVREWCESVMFASWDVQVRKASKNARAKGELRGRWLHTTRTAAFDAKNRYDLPPRLPLEFGEFWRRFVAATPDDVQALLADGASGIAQLRDKAVAERARETLAKCGGDTASLRKVVARIAARLEEQEDAAESAPAAPSAATATRSAGPGPVAPPRDDEDEDGGDVPSAAAAFTDPLPTVVLAAPPESMAGRMGVEAGHDLAPDEAVDVRTGEIVAAQPPATARPAAIPTSVEGMRLAPAPPQLVSCRADQAVSRDPGQGERRPLKEVTTLEEVLSRVGRGQGRHGRELLAAPAQELVGLALQEALTNLLEAGAGRASVERALATCGLSRAERWTGLAARVLVRRFAERFKAEEPKTLGAGTVPAPEPPGGESAPPDASPPAELASALEGPGLCAPSEHGLSVPQAPSDVVHRVRVEGGVPVSAEPITSGGDGRLQLEGTAVCRSCGGQIVWTRTRSGSRMPLDATPALVILDAAGPLSVVVDDDVIRARPAATLEAGRVEARQSHFATCPQANQHRKPKASAAPRPVLARDWALATENVARALTLEDVLGAIGIYQTNHAAQLLALPLEESSGATCGVVLRLLEDIHGPDLVGEIWRAAGGALTGGEKPRRKPLSALALRRVIATCRVAAPSSRAQGDSSPVDVAGAFGAPKERAPW